MLQVECRQPLSWRCGSLPNAVFLCGDAFRVRGHFLCWPLSKGLGTPKPEQDPSTLPHLTGPEAKAGALTEPVSPTETVPASSIWSFMTASSSVKRPPAFLPSKKQSKAFMAPFLLTTQLTTKALARWRRQKSKKEKIKIAHDFTNQR